MAPVPALTKAHHAAIDSQEPPKAQEPRKAQEPMVYMQVRGQALPSPATCSKEPVRGERD